MRESKTHFEQIPVKVVKKIAEEFHEDASGNHKAVSGTSPGKRKPQLQGKRRKASRIKQFLESRINCSICGKPVALETANTDEAGMRRTKNVISSSLALTPSATPWMRQNEFGASRIVARANQTRNRKQDAAFEFPGESGGCTGGHRLWSTMLKPEQGLPLWTRK